jgi:hypothetical protein
VCRSIKAVLFLKSIYRSNECQTDFETGPILAGSKPALYLHLVHLLFDALHFANDGAALGILHPTVDAMVQTFVFTVFCETDACEDSRKISFQSIIYCFFFKLAQNYI